MTVHCGGMDVLWVSAKGGWHGPADSAHGQVQKCITCCCCCGWDVSRYQVTPDSFCRRCCCPLCRCRRLYGRRHCCCCRLSGRDAGRPLLQRLPEAASTPPSCPRTCASHMQLAISCRPTLRHGRSRQQALPSQVRCQAGWLASLLPQQQLPPLSTSYLCVRTSHTSCSCQAHQGGPGPGQGLMSCCCVAAVLCPDSWWRRQVGRWTLEPSTSSSIRADPQPPSAPAASEGSKAP